MGQGGVERQVVLLTAASEPSRQAEDWALGANHHVNELLGSSVGGACNQPL